MIKVRSDLLKAVVEEFRDDAGEEGTADLEAWVRIDFDQVEAEVFIDHKVVTKELKYKVEVMKKKVNLPRRCSGAAAGLS